MHYIYNIMIIITIIFMGNNNILNGMLSCARNIKTAYPKQLLQLHRVHNCRDTSLSNGCIEKFSADRDEEAIKKIALQHIFSLRSIPLGQNCDDKYKTEIIKNEIIYIAKNPQYFCKVYREEENGKAIGFISYRLYPSWYSKMFPEHIGLDAKIYHLAIDNAYRGKGYGSILLKHALDDCKKKNAHSASLWTTAGSFDAQKFYKKEGFNSTRITKLNEEKWEILFQPSHAKIIMSLFLIWLKNKIS